MEIWATYQQQTWGSSKSLCGNWTSTDWQWIFDRFLPGRVFLRISLINWHTMEVSSSHFCHIAMFLPWQSLLGKSDGKSSLFPGPCQDHPKERHLVHHGFSRDLRDSPAAWLIGRCPGGRWAQLLCQCWDASDSPAEVHESLAAPRHEDEKGPGLGWYILQLKGRIGVEKIAIVCNCNIVIYSDTRHYSLRGWSLPEIDGIARGTAICWWLASGCFASQTACKQVDIACVSPHFGAYPMRCQNHFLNYFLSIRNFQCFEP